MTAPRRSKAASAAGRESVVSAANGFYTETRFRMCRALTYCIVATTLCTPCSGAPRTTWKQVRYEGGTVKVKVSPYDWNTTVTVHDDSIVLVFTPSTVFNHGLTLQLKPSQIVSLFEGPLAWRRVAEVPGAVVPARPPKLFGLLSDWAAVGILYEGDDGKRGAVLLQSYYEGAILAALKKVTGKTPESGR